MSDAANPEFITAPTNPFFVEKVIFQPDPYP